LGEAFQPLPQQRVAGGGLGERQFVSSGLEVLAQEGGVMAVARGVDADADADADRCRWAAVALRAVAWCGSITPPERCRWKGA
jgi:hypothetical protein